MRSLMIAAVVATLALGGTTAADAQRLDTKGQRPMPLPAPKPVPPLGQPMPGPNPGSWNGGQWQGGNNGNWQRNGRSRWGSRIGGFWWAGVQAPGGWNSYTRIKRGKRLPGYWVSPNYVINDWQVYGLGAPPEGYYWSRYYNDAVLIDRNGTVYDTIGSVDWGRYQGGYAYDVEPADGGNYADYPPAGYPAPPRGPGYGAPYPAPGYGNSSSSTTTYTYTTGGGYGRGGYPGGPPPRIGYGESYYVAPGSVVTVTMPGAVTTTTTTEYIYERRYAAKVAKKVWRKPVRKWRPRPKPRCSCAPAPIRGS